MAIANGENDMDKNEVLKILETAKDENGEVPMRLVRQAFEKLPEPCGDTIYRQAAIDAMTNTLWHYPNECYRNLNEYEFAKGLAELGLKSVPPAQPETIRCKDCRYYEWMSNRVPDEQTWFCHNWNAETGKYDYCSYAKRREE